MIVLRCNERHFYNEVPIGKAEGYTDDRDVAKGGGGHDSLLVDDGDTLDGAMGGPGYDTCVVDATIEAADTCERVIVN
jgi:hypothetical protein